jgi:hypothetical protein
MSSGSSAAPAVLEKQNGMGEGMGTGMEMGAREEDGTERSNIQKHCYVLLEMAFGWDWRINCMCR